MPLTLIFIFLLALAFATVLFFTRPTKEEQNLNARLAVIGREAESGPTVDDDDLLRVDTLSEVPWADAVLSRLQFSSKLKSEIAQADLKWTVGRVVSGSLLIVVATAWFGQFFINNLIIVTIFALLLGSLPYVYIRYKRGARLRKFGALLPDAIDLMSRALRAGHSITSAVEMIAQEVSPPLGPEFRRLFEEQNFGLPLREAMLNLASRVPLADLQFLVTAILVQKETGGNLVEVLDKTAAVLRDRMRLQGQLRIYTAQGKMTGWILCILPFVVFGVISLLNRQYARILIDNPLGQKLVIVGMIFMACGVLVIRKIIDIKV